MCLYGLFVKPPATVFFIESVVLTCSLLWNWIFVVSRFEIVVDWLQLRQWTRFWPISFWHRTRKCVSTCTWLLSRCSRSFPVNPSFSFLSCISKHLFDFIATDRTGVSGTAVFRLVDNLRPRLPLASLGFFTGLIAMLTRLQHTCQWLRVGRSHYVFLDKLITTGVVGKDYGFMLVWRCHFFDNHLITFGLFLVEVMGLSQYCWPTNIVRLCFWRYESIPLTNNHRSPLFLELRISARRKQWPTSCRADAAMGI